MFLFIFLLAVISAAIFYNYSKGRQLIPSFPSINLPTGLSVLNPLSLLQGSGQESYFLLKLKTKYLNGTVFHLLNTSMEINGLCIPPLSLGASLINVKNPCSILLQSPEGDITVNQDLVTFNSKFNLATIGDISISSQEKLSGEIKVSKLIGSVTAADLKLTGFEGKLTTLTSNGEVSSQINFPPCSELDLKDFKGSITVIDGDTVLSGIAKISYRC